MTRHVSMSGFRGFFRTLSLLLKTARQRSKGRMNRQKKLLNRRTGSESDAMQTMGFLLMLFWMTVIHGMAAYSVSITIQEAGKYTVTQSGRLVVSDYVYSHIEKLIAEDPVQQQAILDEEPEWWLERAAEDREEAIGGSKEEHMAFYQQAILQKPLSDFIPESSIQTGLKNLGNAGGFAVTLASLVFIWWLTMLVFQGEGLELDIQRRRHPMWEWLLSHPVHPGAVFLAEMLSPIAANPAYLGAPLFPAILFGKIYGAGYGILAFGAIGIPLTVAASCFGKSLETAMMLRMSVRTRGAVIGIMGWLGYVALISFAFGAYAAPRIVHVLGGLLFNPAQAAPFSLLLPMLGNFGETSSFWLGTLVCWSFAITLIGTSVCICVWGTQKGLTGNSGSAAPTAGARSEKLIARLGADPLYRKELLWFFRDKSAVIQVILIPLTVAGVQLFNLRHLIAKANNAWHTLSGTAVILGTYFLWVLGPRSLTSEGAALWIAQTWPRGLEDLLKAKARLWFIISSVLVGIVLVLCAIRFPSELWKIALIGVGWAAFGRSMAEKCVTLVTVTKESGETEKIPAGRQMAAALGMLSFGIGVLTQQWQLAILGIVYSWITAAAMWQNFRAHLPYLYDPWEETVPPPPTVMHAMIAISVLVELGAALSGIFIMTLGQGNTQIAMMISYALMSSIVMLGAKVMLENRGLSLEQTWRWNSRNRHRTGTFLIACLSAMAIGTAWGVAAHGYTTMLEHFETFREIIQSSRDSLSLHPKAHIALFISAVFIAPFAEEYLFRGLLFRALDREWGGWKALVGSAAFFAIYHPPIAWVPVGALGLFNAWLFKKTGHLTPCVLLHMVYNAVVTCL